MTYNNPQDIVDLERGWIERRSLYSASPGSRLRSGSSHEEPSNLSSPHRSQSNGKHIGSRWPLLPRASPKGRSNHKRKESKVQYTPNRLSDVIFHRIRAMINVSSYIRNIPWALVVLILQSILLFCLLLYRHSSFLLHTGSGITRVIDKTPFLIGMDVLSTTISHLVVVPGHAVVLNWNSNARDDSAWWLYQYQQGRGVPSLIVDHIEAGVKVAAEDPTALLMFSGGATRQGAGPRTEACSYFYVADAMGWWGHTSISNRTVLEEYARDSFENVLFPIARFREVVGRYPSNITIVGFDFKENRFRNQHRAALHLPESMFEYKGITSNVGSFDFKAAQKGEKETSIAFEQNPYVCMNETPNFLFEKRKSRDPFRRIPPYALSAPEIANLLNWCGPELYNGPLPWSEMSDAEQT